MTKINALIPIFAALLVVSACSDDTPVDQSGDTSIQNDVEDDTSNPDVDDRRDADSGAACGSQGNDEDCDDDGLLDCEEEQLGTDPCNHDSDGDGLNDMQEVLYETDPLDPDTDGDGLEDGRERDLGLDPTKQDSFDDGTLDSERWIVTACDDNDAATVDHHINDGPGDWRLALAPGFGNYTELSIDGADASNLHAAAVFSDTTLEVAGTVISAKAPADDTSPNQLLSDHHTTLASLGSLDQNALGGEFRTHDYKRAAIGRFLISLPAETSAEAFRDDLIAELAPFGADDISGLPAANGTSHDTFRVFIAAIVRESNDASEHVVTLVSVAPSTGYETNEEVVFAMDDLTNTNQLADAGASTLERCDLFEPRQPVFHDFYWVIDHTSSMSAHADRVRDAAADFYEELSNANLARQARLGVTTMELSRGGRIDADTGWQQDRQTFLDQIDAAVDNGSSAQEPHGLEAARQGISYMQGAAQDDPADQERITAQGQLITIFVSDKEAQTFRDDPLEDPDDDTHFNDLADFFSSKTVAFALTGDGEECGEEDGQSYQLIAEATGGAHDSLCSADISELTGDLVYSTHSSTGGFQFPDAPIPSSIRVFVNGDELTRSRENGFDYFMQNNAFALFGDARLEPTAGPASGHYIVVLYEAFGE